MKDAEKTVTDTARPTGWLGKLYDETGINTRRDPADYIREVAQKAVEAGILDQRKMTVLQNRFPLPGFPRKTLRETAETMGLAFETIRQIEFRIYLKLKKLLGEKM